ncbi:MAG: DUF3592 domain-containing protein [Lachnospiraceae bacterium]|nr:DUF3592 domain-containing protein [Lachnospiraceae bacterium]
MEKEMASLLCLLTVGGTGVFLIILGIVFSLLQKRKVRSCTASVSGRVISYRFPGEGRMAPIVEYQVAGTSYTVCRKFRGYVTVRKTMPGNLYADDGAWVSEKDVLHVPMCAVTNLEGMARRLWPPGSEMRIYYNPNRPQQACAEKLPARRPVLTTVYVWAGIGVIALAVLVAFLIRM